MSIKVQVIFYSMCGHIYKMAQAVAEGAKQSAGD
jgi:NAD(P)H dehydrogenase (quinone)